ncbi:MAG TPA: hypothetical protein VFL76_05895 [Edaphocola sp.]|nr:hypothetical protein [Edaphocola sp.]
MKYQSFYSFPVVVFLLLVSFSATAQKVNTDSLAQVRRHLIDSTQKARQHSIDSMRQARQQYLDSLKTVRQQRLDSMRLAQKVRTDSLKAIQAYRKSDRYKDSVAAIRQHVQDSIMVQRQRILDSTKQARQHYTDSLVAARKYTVDSMKQARQKYLDSLHTHLDSVKAARTKSLAILKAERQRRSDSLAVIRAYRESDRYKDSLALVRKQRRDSLIAVRKHYTDSVRTVQKAYTDSLIAVRKQYNDSLRAAMDSMRLVRQHMIDSMTTVRKARADSLAKVRAAREADRDKKKKEQEKKKSLAFEMKINEKHEKYSNKKMLKKKWSLPRRITQNTFTRYNYYYNANLKMEEARENMLRANQDNYDTLLRLFPFDPNVDSAKLASDMDTVLSKAAVGIQIHDPRSKWQDDLYLLVGEAYYYKADYENAGAAFKQIIVADEKQRKRKAKKQNKSHPNEDNKQQAFSVARKKGIGGLLQHMPAKNEAMLWLARVLVQNGKEGQAQSLLDMLRNDANFPGKMKGRLALEQAFIDLKRADYKNAVPSLKIVSADDNVPKWQRQRAGFMIGQLYNNDRLPDSANKYFRKALALHPPIQMDFYARKQIAFNEINSNGHTDNSVALLSGLAKDGKYKPFYDQIYYGLALAAQKEGKPDEAMADFRKSLSYGRNNPKQMGLTYTAIGDAFYDKRAYLPAKRAYDSAAIMLGNYQMLPEYEKATLRGSSLARIVDPAQTVALQDSLLHLASLPENEQRTLIRKHIRQLEKAKQDSLFLAQNVTAAPAGVNSLPMTAPVSTWYFSSSSRVNSGKIAFQQKWGGRKLADNWRLSSSQFGANAITQGQQDASAPDGNDLGLPDEDVLYAAIPHTPEEIRSAKQALEEALFSLGKDYYTYLEDFENAQSTFDTLEQKFPDNPHKAEVLYLRYLMAMRNSQTVSAGRYLQQLESRFPDSEWSKLLKSSSKNGSNEAAAQPVDSAKQSIDSYYDETYNMLLNKQYALVLDRAQSFSNLYPAPGAYANKFSLLKAVALVGSGAYKPADSLLDRFIAHNANDSLAQWARDIKKYIRDHYGNPASSQVTGTDTTGAPQQVAAEFTYDAKAQHLIIIAAPADMRIFALKSGLRDFNMMRAGSENISVSMTTLDPDNNMIVIQQFDNLQDAQKYYQDIIKNKTLFREYTQKDYHLLLISRNNYSLLMSQRSLDKYLTFYDRHYH